MNSRRCWVEVDGRALRHNVKLLRQLIPRETQLMAVVKANAYGHGLLPVSRELMAAGVDWLGVANVAEGIILREAGLTAPILLLSAALPEEYEDAVRYNLVLTVSSLAEAKMLHRVAHEVGDQAPIHFKVDTGMGRLGCWYENARAELKKIQSLSGLMVEGLYTHFASADDNAGMTKAQWKLVTPFFAEHPELLCHAANSPAVTRGYGFQANLVRAGLALYGVATNKLSGIKQEFRPALTWKSRITMVREVGPDRTVSYGATYRTKKTERHATVAMGYGDGYFRAHSNGVGMLVRGKLCPIRGRVTMDQVVLDVTNVPSCRVGDEVVALGQQGKAEITASALASEAGTIPWEIFTNISSRVQRVYHHFETEVPPA